MKDQGWQAYLLLVKPDSSATSELEDQLRKFNYHCVTIGGGIGGRLQPEDTPAEVLAALKPFLARNEI